MGNLSMSFLLLYVIYQKLAESMKFSISVATVA